jgi:hypothetical protein
VLEVEVGCAAARDLVEVEEAGAVRSMWVFLRQVEGEEGAGRRTGVEGSWISWSPEPRPLTVRKEKKKDGEHGLGEWEFSRNLHGSERIEIKADCRRRLVGCANHSAWPEGAGR